MLSVLENYNELLNFLSEFSSTEKNDAGSKAYGFLCHLQKSDTFIMLKLVSSILKHMETTNSTLQSKILNFKMSFSLINTLKNTISHMRDTFSTMWNNFEQEWTKLDLDPPKQPRRRKRPIKYEFSNSTDTSFTAESQYDKIYKEIIHYVLSGIEARFNNEAKCLLENAEEFLINPNSNPKYVDSFFKDDFNISRLKLHRDMLHDILAGEGLQPESFKDILDIFKTKQHLVIHLTEIHKLIQLFLTIPLTTCTTERSFSMLRRLKTYLRSTMSQQRLNHLAILNCHKTICDSININLVENHFIKKILFVGIHLQSARFNIIYSNLLQL